MTCAVCDCGVAAITEVESDELHLPYYDVHGYLTKALRTANLVCMDS